MSELPANLIEKLEELAVQFDACEADLLSPEIVTDHKKVRELSIRRAALERIVSPFRAWQQAHSEQAEAAALLTDECDEDMRAMAKEEIVKLESEAATLAENIQSRLVRADDDAIGSVILEIRAGVGGDEAALWAGDLLEMYRRYAERQRWNFEVLSARATDMGGFREVVVNVRGRSVYTRLGYEGGGHRVQRVPKTESQGRVHTSAATVAVLPEAEEVDLVIHDKDLRIDVYRASGPGGQSVNTTDSAVRITHLPTGLVVTQQDEKSQHKNRAKALKVLRARLYDHERMERDAERAEARRGQVGSGDRSERIRTYNYPQGRVTDHRINLTLHKLDKILSGEALDEIVDALLNDEQTRRLAQAN